MNETLELLALAYQYPQAGSVRWLFDGLKNVPKGAVKAHLERFVQTLSHLTLSEREELYTRTLDLTPLTAPYVGYAVYGEDYRRGSLMAALNRAMLEAGIALAGELPDHLSPVLRYLAIAPEPLPELLQILPPALKQIEHTLRTLEPGNPYLGLLEATQEAVAAYIKGHQPVLAGRGR